VASQQIWASWWFGTAILLVLTFRVVGQETRPGESGNVKASMEKTDAKTLIRAARAALERGDLDRAETLTAEAVFPLPLPAGLEPARVQIAGSTINTVQTPRDSAVFQQKFAELEVKSQALLLLVEAGKALLAGKSAIAREYTLQAKNLRPSSSWNQKDLVQLRAFLQRQAGTGPGRPGEHASEPRNRTPPGSSSRWFVVAGVAAIILFGVALRRFHVGSIVNTGMTSN
jgi:hypothetical protein